MTTDTIPSEYFTGIKYNPTFFASPTGVSIDYVNQNYLKRNGALATSVATSTTFSGYTEADNVRAVNTFVATGSGSKSISVDSGIEILTLTGYSNGIELTNLAGGSVSITGDQNAIVGSSTNLITAPTTTIDVAGIGNRFIASDLNTYVIGKTTNISGSTLIAMTGDTSLFGRLVVNNTINNNSLTATTNNTFTAPSTSIVSGVLTKITTNATDTTLSNNTNDFQTTGTGVSSFNRFYSALGQNKLLSGKTAGSANLIDATGAGINEITSASGALGANTITATSGTGSNIIQATTAGGGNKISTTSGTNTITSTTGRNTLTTANTTTTANLIDATGGGGGNTIRATNATGSNTISATAGGSNTITTTSGTNTMSATAAGGNNTISTTSGTNTISNVAGQTTISATGGGDNLISTDTSGTNTIASVDGAISIQSSGGGNLQMNANGTGEITLYSAGVSADINITSGRNIDLTGVLTNNTATFNPRRTYQLNYTNGGNSGSYGLEIIRAVDDPNNPYTTNRATNGKTYIEIFCNGNAAAGYNATRINGYFISSGNSDGVTQSDFAIETYAPLENHYSPILTGSTGTTYLSFIFYLVGGFNYTIITDGRVGNYFNNIVSVSPFEQWALTSNVTYNTGATATFAIMKVANTGVDFLGVTASSSTILAPDIFNEPQIYNYTTARENKWKMTNSKMLSSEQYIGSPATGVIVPVCNFVKSANRTTFSTSTSALNWISGDDSNNVCLRASIPFQCRVIGVEVNFDLDATPPAVSVQFQVYIGNSSTIGSATYLDTGSLMIITTGSWSTTLGNTISCNPTGSLVAIPANITHYASWRSVNSSTLAAVNINQEFIITFYYQQIE